MKWDLLSSKEFEKLALKYAKFKYKDYAWKPTDDTRDDNHDFFYREIDDSQQIWEGWGEAKHSGKVKTGMSRTKWDQTIVSGKLANNVRHIMFVTNANIPNRYIFRAECLKTPPYEKFEYVNNTVLENWLYNNPQYIPAELKPSFNYKPKCIKRKLTYDFFVVDYFSSYRNILNAKKEVYVNKDYLLFVVIESNFETQLTLGFEPEDMIELFPYGKENITMIPIELGINCFKYIINFRVQGKHTIKATVQDGYSKKIYKKNLHLEVLNDFEPQISYKKQFNILELLLDILGTAQKENNIYTLYAPKGAGKTYLLRMLLREHRLFNQLLFLSFDYDIAECSRNMCILFLAINFGMDFSDSVYWKETLQLYDKYPEEEKLLSLQDLHAIYNGSQKDCTEDSLLGFEKIKAFTKRNKFRLFKSGMKQYITFFMDDVHKIPEPIAEVLTEFIKEYTKASCNGKILIAAREYEFQSERLKNIIIDFSSKNFYLDSPTITEKQKALKKNFPFISNTDYFLPILAKCHSTMHFCILLRQIHNFVETNGKDESKLQMQVSSLLADTSKKTLPIEHQEFLVYRKDFYLIFLIYAYGSGVNKDFFKTLGAENFNKILRLIKAGILEEQGNYIFPAHDTYQEVFNKACQGTQFYEEKKQAAKLLAQHLNSEYIDKYKALSVLLLLDENYDDIYMEESINLLNSYYKTTEFGKMNLLCERLINKKYPYPEKDEWTGEKLWLFYLYAECLDHCGSLQLSQEYFEMIYDNGISQITDDSLDFLFDAKAQIFNIRYALLDTENLLDDIDDFLKKYFFKIKVKHSTYFERAFLNALNRRMMISLLLDKYEAAQTVSQSYHDFSSNLGNISHQAFYYIDYARGNYHRTPQDAFKYMKMAYKKFSELPDEKRRLIDSKSEMYFLDCVINKTEPKDLDQVSEEILRNGYVHMYVHTLLKRAAVRICRGELNIAQNLLNKISSIIDLEKFTRTKLLFSNLMSAICFLQNNNKMMEEYIKIQNQLAQAIGKSYQNNRKIDALKGVNFNCYPGDDYFPIETRLW